MKKIVYIIFVALLAAVAGPVCGQHTLGNIPEGWKVKANGDSVPVVNGTATITGGATVVLTPPNPAFVKSVTLTDAPAPAPSCRRITLDTVQHHFVAQDCDTLTGTLGAKVKISIADGATVTLDGVSINADGNWTFSDYAGITCLGNATIILKDDTMNTVKGFYNDYPGIFVPVNSTLTIQGGASGTGKLIASSNGYGAGIGGGYQIPCGNIRIEDGIIEATGGRWAAGIGSGNEASCGDIMITSGVTSVTATKGENAPNSIGKGLGGSCGMITFGTQQMYNGTTWTTTPTNGEIYGGLNFTIKTTTSNNDTWELTPASAPVISCRRVDLSQITADSVIQNCDTLTGTLGANVKISIADGATVTLDNVTIKGTGSSSYNWAGITCLGSATIILKDDTTNTVWGFDDDNPGIYVPVGSTLTIQGETLGTGKLICQGNEGAGIGGGKDIPCGSISIKGGIIEATGYNGAGIGSGYGYDQGGSATCGDITISGGTVTAITENVGAGIGSGGIWYGSASCGTITITGGTVNATAGWGAAGIGSGSWGASCGAITITGGTVNATGGESAAGIGSGYEADCGAITITSGVTSVTATKGAGAPNSIGAGIYGTCGTVTIGGTVYWQNNAYVGDGATYLMQSQIVYPAP